MLPAIPVNQGDDHRVGEAVSRSTSPICPQNSPSTGSTAPRKRSVATSPIIFAAFNEPPAKKSRVLKPAAGALISLEQLEKMPLDVWLLVMNLFSPIDLLNLADADLFFKALITKSPKRWAWIQKRTDTPHYYPPIKPGENLHTVTYRLTCCSAWWEEEKTYRLVYGDQYEYARTQRHGFRAGEAKCRGVAPGVDREPAAAQDLHILLHNAVFDQLGFGAEWRLPAPEKYKTAPYMRAHTAMLPIKGPKDEVCRQIAAADPFCVAVHADPDGKAGDIRSTITEVTSAVPGVKKLWIHFGRNITEIGSLVDVKAPNIVAYMSLVKDVTEENRTSKVPDAELLEQFDKTVIPTLRTIMEQWERGEREIGYILLHSRRTAEDDDLYEWERFLDWHHLDPEFFNLPRKLGVGRIDPYHIGRNSCLIRRARFSNSALMIVIRGPTLMLASCSHTHRCNSYLNEIYDDDDAAKEAAKKMKQAIAEAKDANGKVVADTDLLGLRRRRQIVVDDWAKMKPYSTIPTRELAIERFIINRGYSTEKWPFVRNYIMRYWQQRRSLRYCTQEEDPILTAYRQLLTND